LDTPLNVRFGKIQPEVSLWNETNKLISTPITIRDINGLALADAQNGIELDTVVGSRLLLEAGIVEREIGDTPGGDTVSKKEYYGHAAVKIGGTDFLGKEPEVDLDNPSIWDFLAIRVGVFGYTGKDLDSDALTSGDTSDLYRAGLETEILYKKWRAMLAGVIGQDEDSVNPTVKSTGFSGEVNYQFMAKLIGVVHYDYLNEKEGDGITRHIIPGVVFAPLQTFRIKLYVNKELDEKSHNTTGTMSVTWAF
jgi:hypothetical protein